MHSSSISNSINISNNNSICSFSDRGLVSRMHNTQRWWAQGAVSIKVILFITSQQGDVLNIDKKADAALPGAGAMSCLKAMRHFLKHVIYFRNYMI